MKALIVDPDPEFLDSIAKDAKGLHGPRLSALEPLLALTGADAQRLLSERDCELAGIFVNPRVARPGGISVIRCAHQLRPGTPIFLLSDPAPGGDLEGDARRGEAVH